eukprot:TRINITY_DN767_c0_g1_i2.p1 TRINITY_DN767_c0_g1~~TRINITY_DN767_c0_g1_i2.p1  ORF type:complete len:222 (+),score=35.38 TRINITY_DN767_c0_g1_i2:109-774(+)
MSSLSCHHALSNMFVPVPTSHCSKVSRIPVPRSGKLQGLIVRCQAQSRKASNRRASKVPERKEVKKKQYHLWKGKGNCRSGQKARAVVDIVLKLPSTKEAVCGALDQWVAWEEEFPSIAVAKALRILKKRSQWLQLIQVFADMEELNVKPDESTAKKVANAFKRMGHEDKHNQVLMKYRPKWKYLHFKGEKVRVPYGSALTLKHSDQNCSELRKNLHDPQS